MRLHHLAFRTGDLEGLCRFYRDVLGLREARDARPRSVWLALDGPAVLMIEARTADEPAYPKGSSELVAFAVTAAERAAIEAKAEARGCHDGRTEYTTYVRDPEGRRIGVSTYPLGALGEAR
jgi:catechol 2,3-dioxygenase-like lactoylglutathione lyase family enzyme